MSIPDLKTELDQEVSAILAASFKISVTKTTHVPHADDGAITFPNLADGAQGCKLIDTCVLYIDIRRSTELNLAHRAETVAKLYSAFVRAMTRCARYFGGHVRGIIGDRLMVIFDCDNAFKNAVDTACLMNGTSKYVMDKHFKANEIACGIGIDAGRMLATKTGFIRRGSEQPNYRNLVWLGRPANVASKLTDLANKPGETAEEPYVRTAYAPTIMHPWNWVDEEPIEFIRNLETGLSLRHKHPNFRSVLVSNRTVTKSPTTPPILVTKAVWQGLCTTAPDEQIVKNNWFEEVKGLKVAGYNGAVYGGDVIYTAFRLST